MKSIQELTSKALAPSKKAIQVDQPGKNCERATSLPVAKTVQQAIELNAPTLKMIMNESPRMARQLVGIEITKAQAAMNFEKKMDANQIQEACEMVTEQYRQLTTADVQVIFRKARAGHYGATYNRFDELVIGEWIQKYLDDRPIKILPSSVVSYHQTIK